MDRVLCATAGPFGIVAFVAGMHTEQPVGIAVGIAALVVSLSVASFVVRQ